MTTTDKTYVWDDMMHMRVRYTVNTHTVEFRACTMTGTSEADYAFKNAETEYPNERDFDKAETYLTGFLRFDGCSHWKWGEANCLNHVCGGLHGVQEVAAHMEAIAKEAIGWLKLSGTWQGGLFDS